MQSPSARKTKLEVSEACAAALVAHGDASLTVKELAAAGGVSERTFYRMFATKEESLRPLLDEGNRLLAEELRATPTSAGLVDGVARAFAATLGAEFAVRARQLMPIVFQDVSLRAVWQAASFDTAALIREDVARLGGHAQGGSEAWVTAGRVVVAVIAALSAVVQADVDPELAMRAALVAAEAPLQG